LGCAASKLQDDEQPPNRFRLAKQRISYKDIFETLGFGGQIKVETHGMGKKQIIRADEAEYKKEINRKVA
jgi:hypothetical protein